MLAADPWSLGAMLISDERCDGLPALIQLNQGKLNRHEFVRPSTAGQVSYSLRQG